MQDLLLHGFFVGRPCLRPHLVLEQAAEEGSPHTLDAVTAHRQGQEHVRWLFAWMQE